MHRLRGPEGSHEGPRGRAMSDADLRRRQRRAAVDGPEAQQRALGPKMLPARRDLLAVQTLRAYMMFQPRPATTPGVWVWADGEPTIRPVGYRGLAIGYAISAAQADQDVRVMLGAPRGR